LSRRHALFVLGTKRTAWRIGRKYEKMKMLAMAFASCIIILAIGIFAVLEFETWLIASKFIFLG